MKKKWSWKKITAVGASMALALSLSFGLIFSNISLNGAGDNAAADNNTTNSVEGGGTDRVVSNYAATITYPNGAADLGRFPEGYTYTFTDKTKVDNYRARKIDSDLTSVKVVSTAAAGTQQNPYVIANETDWENFAKKIGTNNGAGKFFVLANDIDFSGKTFHSAYSFQGTFYGIGHSLKNITVSNWQTYRSGTTLSDISSYTSGYGVFDNISNATITDLIVDTYLWQNLPIMPTGAPRYSATTAGGIAGFSAGTSYLLNCHTLGAFTSTLTYSNYSSIGGIVGAGQSSTTTFYRCSSKITGVTLKTSGASGPIVAGLIGEMYSGSSAAAPTTVKVYDCAANVNNNNATDGSCFGALIVGWVWSYTALTAENMVGTVTTTSTTPIWGGGLTAIANNLVTPTLKNLYGDVRCGGKVFYAVTGNAYPANGLSTISNLNIVKKSTDSYVNSFITNCGNCLKNWTKPPVTEHASNEAMLTKAKNSVGDTASHAFYSGIWDASKIDGNYDPEHSPVRNYLNAIIDFKETDETPIQLAGEENPVVFSVSDAEKVDLPKPANETPTGKKFLGWSLDKTSDATVYNVFPAGVYGNVTMYPVWELTDALVATDVNAEEGADGEKDVSNKTLTAKYISGEPVAKIKATLSLPSSFSADDCEITWKWYKGNDLIEDADEDTLVIKEFGSGIYHAEASVRHKTQLWRTTDDLPSGTWTVIVEKGVLKQGGITLMDQDASGKDIFAYYGQPLHELTDYVVTTMTNTAGLSVSGTVDWGEDNYNTPVDRVQANYAATFVPDDQERYENTPISVTITPTILQLNISVSLANVSRVFSYDVAYGTVYTGSEVADMFEEDYFALLDELMASNKSTYDAMVGRMPFFPESLPVTSDASGLPITTYRTGTEGQTKRAFFDADGVARENYIVKNKTRSESGVVTSTSAVLTIPVTFASTAGTDFEVKLWNNVVSGNKEDTTLRVGYGALIDNPIEGTPVYTDTDGKVYFLAGWFASDSQKTLNKDTDGNVTSPVWGFASDRINSLNTYILADWREGTLTLTGIESVRVRDGVTFTARNTPRTSDFVVRGTYTVTGEGSQNTQITLTLSPDDYTVEANVDTNGTTFFGDKNYHVHALSGYTTGNNDRVVVTAYDSSNRPIRKTLDIFVGTKYISMTGINFPPVSVEEGSAANLSYPPVTDFAFLTNQGVVVNTDFVIAQNIYTYRTADGREPDLNAVGIYYVSLSIKWLTLDFESDPVSTTFTVTEKAQEVYVEWNANGGVLDGEVVVYTYNGLPQQPEARFYQLSGTDKVYLTIVSDYEGNKKPVVASDSYEVSVVLSSTRYKLASDAQKSIRFKINKAAIRVPTLSTSEFIYQPEGHDVRDYLPYNEDQLKNLLNVNGYQNTNVGSYKVTIELKDPQNSMWDGDAPAVVELPWTIARKVMAVPTFTETLTYSGEAYVIKDHLNFFDDVAMKVSETSQGTGTNAGSYRAVVQLANNNYAWATEFTGTITWTIQKAEIFLGWNGWSFTQDNSFHSPRVTSVGGLVPADQQKAEAAKEGFTYTGDYEMRSAGVYELQIAIKTTEEFRWLYENYTINAGDRTLSWVIKNEGERVITLQWDLPSSGIYTYDGNILKPEVVSIFDEETGMPVDIADFRIDYSGDTSAKWAGGPYTVTATVVAIDGTPLRVRGPQVSFSIRQNSAGEGTDPDSNKPTPKPDGDGDGDNPSTGRIASLPQLIISGVSLVLILVFTIMTFNYASVAKNAKAKAKKLAQMTYSFAPFGLLAPGLLGLSDGNWWIVAGVFMGVALLMAIVMFVFRGKSRHALAMLEEEQERIEEEKEMARLDREAAKEAQQEARDAQMREEQQRRDNEFKMMFAALQQNYQQPQVGYDDMQNMITSAVTALLPGLQQTMQALPPAQSESDDLRNVVAQQQEMLNQLMQERNASYSAPAQQTYEEPSQVAEAAFTSTPDEQFTLEELYGKMTDEAKRLYYEIGGYIMSKPNTNQNDGKYAVLFKYRGKTLFKLCIKGDAPILYYLLENNVQGEVPITSAAALEDAKDVVDIRMKRVDRELNG